MVLVSCAISAFWTGRTEWPGGGAYFPVVITDPWQVRSLVLAMLAAAAFLFSHEVLDGSPKHYELSGWVKLVALIVGSPAIAAFMILYFRDL